jgi:hypothetical protein
MSSAVAYNRAARRWRSMAGALVVALVAGVLQGGALRAAGPAPTPRGYWLVASDGGIFAHGDARFFGSTGAIRLNQPIVGMAATPSGNGYWLVATDGGIFSFGDARFFGSTGAIRLNRPIVGMAATPSGRGYWLVASDGGIFSFGDARFFGSTGAIRLNRPIVGMTSTPSGNGYWLVATDGGIFSFGDARFFGSTGAMRLNRPIAGMTSTPSGAGYWLLANDGGIFTFGDARFHGAAPQRAPRPGTVRSVVSMAPSPSGQGYWQASTAGELLAFGDAPDLGGPSRLNHQLVGMASFPYRPTPPTPPTTIAPPIAGAFSDVANKTWGTSPALDRAGLVLSVVEAAGKVYLAGEFTGMVAPGRGGVVPRQHMAALDAATGELLPWDPRPDGPVRAMALSADGRRLYVGGTFESIGGVRARNLAALDLATGAVDESFSAPWPNSGVRAFALAGDRLYLGGNFTNVVVRTQPGAGQYPRSQVAAIDASSGALIDWSPPVNSGGRFVGHTGKPTDDGKDGLVHAVAVSRDGRTVHIGGDFLDFGGQGGLLSLDAATGQPTLWQAKMDHPRPVFGLTISPADGRTVFAATGGTGGALFAFDPVGKPTARWYARVDGDAVEVVATSSLVYLIGHYDYIVRAGSSCSQRCPDGTRRHHLAAFEVASGKLDSWSPEADTTTGPYTAAFGANRLYVGGEFTQINLKPQPGIAQFDAVR